MKQPPYIINPNMRMSNDIFSLQWQCVPQNILERESRHVAEVYRFTINRQCQFFCTTINSDLWIYYSEQSQFNNIRMQSALRKQIKCFIYKIAMQIIPIEFHEAEQKVNLKASSLEVKKLCKDRLGDCDKSNKIRITISLIVFPKIHRQEVYTHELCHTIHHNHSKKFWTILSEKLGRDAKSSKCTTDVFCCQFYEQICWLIR